MLVNGRAIARLTPARIGAISALIRGGSPVDQWPDNLFTIDTHIERRDLLLVTPLEPGEALDAAIARGAAGHDRRAARAPELRGRGGAGFSAGQKWAACAGRSGPRALRRVQRRRGRAGHLQGPRAPGRPRRPRDRGHDGRGLRGVGAQRGFIYLRASIRS
jgi:[NiFe] hydrogenase diaphorase moiety large subunit